MEDCSPRLTYRTSTDYVRYCFKLLFSLIVVAVACF